MRSIPGKNGLQMAFHIGGLRDFSEMVPGKSIDGAFVSNVASVSVISYREEWILVSVTLKLSAFSVNGPKLATSLVIRVFYLFIYCY